MVGHILLYHPAVVKLRQLIQQGALGRILYCYSNRLNMGLIRTEENILWSFAPHDISVILHLLGEEPIAAEADGQSYLTPGVVDVTLSRLKFKSGASGHIFVSWLHPSKEQRLVIVGTEKMAVFDDTAEKKLLLYPHHVDWIGRAPKAVKAEPVAVELDKAEPLKEECRHFLDCVASRKTPLSDGREGLRVLRVLDACQQSLERRAAAAVARPRRPPPDYFVHPSAYVDQPCSIGAGTKIWHFSHVMKGAVVGANCAIGQNVVISSAAVIGNGVKIQNNVSVYDAVTLEDGVFCGPSMVFTNVINPRSEIVRKNEYRPTLDPARRHFGGQLHDRLRPYRGALRLRGGRGRGEPATWPTSPWWRACRRGRSAGCAAARRGDWSSATTRPPVRPAAGNIASATAGWRRRTARQLPLLRSEESR